jgi:hypothetical protein
LGSKNVIQNEKNPQIARIADLRGPQAARRVGDTDVSNESVSGWRTLRSIPAASRARRSRLGRALSSVNKGDDFNTPAFNKGAITLRAADHYQAGHDPLRALATGNYQESGLNKWLTEIVHLPVFCIVLGP